MELRTRSGIDVAIHRNQNKEFVVDTFKQKKRGHAFAVCTALIVAFLIGAGVPARADSFAMESGEFSTGPTSPGKWGSPTFGTGANVTWSLMATGVDLSGDASHPGASTALSAFMPAGWYAAIVAAFNAWSSIADITFTEVPDTGEAFNAAGGSGDIRIGGAVFDGAGGTLAHGFFPPVNGAPSGTAAGDIHFDIADTWKIGFGGGGFDIFTVAAHEIGHAIGLGHTSASFYPALMLPVYSEAYYGLQADDIAGAQYIYGVPEPSTILLITIAFVGLLGVRGRMTEFESGR